MKLALASLVCAAFVATAAAYQGQDPPPVQNPPPAPAQEKTVPDVTLTGCLLQGSSPSVFIFDNARKDPKSNTEKGARYLVVLGAEDLNLRPHLNHEVQMIGQIEAKVPPTGKVEEKDLLKFTTKSVVMVSNTCSVAGTN
jgi:hypothetical protein